MAHFAQLDENNVVTQVIVVSNDDTSDSNELKLKASVLLSVRNSLVLILTGSRLHIMAT